MKQSVVDQTWRWRANKWAMCGYKGGKCSDGGTSSCLNHVTGENIERFHFDHKIKLNSGQDCSERWQTVRMWAPFTERWFLWADTINLICEKCHRERHNPTKQLLIDWDFQERMDEYDKRELLMENGTRLAMDDV